MSKRPSSARPMTSVGRQSSISGQGSNARPPSAMGRQQSIGGRPSSSMGRPQPVMERPSSAARSGPMARPSSSLVAAAGAAARTSTGSVKGRMGTASGARPGTSRIGVPNVSHRPVTQQGMQGVRPATTRGLQMRQVQDKSYYMGLLRAKITELNTETNRLRKDMDHYDKERQNYSIYENKAENLATEIKDLQGQLADYNTLVDKLNTNADVQEMRDEYEQLKNQNDVESQSLDNLFSERKRKEDEVKQLEVQMEEERARAASLMTDMDGHMRRKYENLKEENESLVEDLRLKQQELASLTAKKEELEDELVANQLKREAMALYEKQTELEAKRDAILAEMNAEGTPEQQRERLLDKVKKDNEEIASMERQAAEVRERIEQIHEETRELDEEMEDQQSEKNQKYRELRQKEVQMDEFLDTYEQTKMSDLQRIQEYEKSIVRLLELTSKALSQNAPADLKLESSQNEPRKLGTTPGELMDEHQRLQSELNRIDEVEEKSKDELDSIKEKMTVMQQELEVFTDLRKLESEIERKKDNLMREKDDLAERIESTRNRASEMQNEYERLRSELNDNDSHVQLNNLEKKLQHIEQNNFALKEVVASHQAETNIGPVKENVLSMIVEYNQMLIQSTGGKINPRIGSS